MSLIKSLLLLTSVLLLSGCLERYSEAPVAVNFESSKQKVVQAAQHWDIINQNVSKSLIESLAGKVNSNERILIKPENSIYSEQLYLDLVRSLTSNGYKVVKYDFKPNAQNRYQYQLDKNKPKYDIAIELKTEVLKFRRGRKQAGTVGYPTSIVSGLWFLKVLEPTVYGAATIGAFALDANDWFDDEKFGNIVPRTEIIIDLVATRADEYVATSKGIYYVAETDSEMYRAVKSIEPHIHEYNTVGNTK